MKRNTALNLLAWISVLIIIGTTPISAYLQNMVALAIPGEVWGAAEAYGPRIVSDVMLIAFAILLGRIFIAIWGDKPEPKAARDPQPLVITALIAIVLMFTSIVIWGPQFLQAVSAVTQ